MAKHGTLTDEDILSIVRLERASSIGMEFDDVLNKERETALNYYKGSMPDLKVGRNRSSVVSSDVADAVETVLPDIMDTFTGGEDVLTFSPNGPEDEQAAKQETDYLAHCLFQRNDGWMTMYQVFKDALISKVGVFKYWWDDTAEYDSPQEFRQKTQEEVAFVQMMDPALEVMEVEPEKVEGDQPPYPEGEEMPTLYRFKVRKKRSEGKLCIKAVPPEDFTVAVDTVSLKDATYCAMRTRVRAQELIAQGYDQELVDQLSTHDPMRDETVDQARDNADESDQSTQAGSDYRLRTVEIVEHYIRLDADNSGELKIYRVVTGENEKVLLDREERDCIEFAAVCPFPQSHRFYGLSLADKLLEVQRIKTVLLRMLLDSGYFAVNQRYEVATQGSGDTTLEDLLRNEPGFPIRSETGQAVRAIQPAQLGFDPYMALEYVSTMAEMRTGVVRNAQGLNPDSLHETAKGAIALMSMAQKRVRMIARIFAETGVKDLFLGAHHLLRKHATMQDKFRLRGEFVPIDPTNWGSRNDMEIQIGVGSGGKDQRLAAYGLILSRMEQLLSAGGPFATIAPPESVYEALLQEAEAAGIKGPERFYMEPQPVEEGEDPEAAKAQAEMQMKMQEAQMKAQVEQMKAQMRAEVDLQREMIREQGRAEQRTVETELAELRLELKALLELFKIQAGQGGSNLPQFNPGGAIDR
jgi:hypothetical protein